MKLMTTLTAALLLASTAAWTDPTQPHWVLSHAPMGVMGDLTHAQGEWMVSYRYMSMDMSGLRRGEDNLSLEQSFNDYMMVPLDMSMDMHMLGVMYAPTERVTLMAMFNHSRNEMRIRNRMGLEFQTASEGTGDTKFGALITLKDWGNNLLHANLNLSIPTGSINPRDTTPMGPDSLLPYTIRLSSGTYDAQLGLTWNQYHETHSFGAQWLSTWRTGENDADYRLGHEQRFNAWGAKSFTPSWIVSVRLEALNRQAIQGADARLMMFSNMTPTAAANNSGVNFIQLGLGLNYVSNHDNWTRGHRIGLEWINPVQQDLNGTQMRSDDQWVIAWQKAF